MKKILLEKPGAVNEGQLIELEQLAMSKGAEIYLAYNRRFFSSVLEAQKRIQEEGGVTSFHFEFTEWSHIIGNLKKSGT